MARSIIEVEQQKIMLWDNDWQVDWQQERKRRRNAGTSTQVQHGVTIGVDNAVEGASVQPTLNEHLITQTHQQALQEAAVHDIHMEDHNDMGDEMGDVTMDDDGEQAADRSMVIGGRTLTATGMCADLYVDGRYQRMAVQQVLEYMGQRHYTFRYPSKFPNLVFQVLPGIDQQYRIDDDQYHIVAAYISNGKPVPYCSTYTGYDQWSVNLYTDDPLTVTENHHYLPLCHAVWEYTSYMNRGVIEEEVLEDNGLLQHIRRAGKG